MSIVEEGGRERFYFLPIFVTWWKLGVVLESICEYAVVIDVVVAVSVAFSC